MKLQIQKIDAFTEKVFGGNPAAVCELGDWLPAEILQAIASENNLSETAFFVRVGEGRYLLRWFTPRVEVDLCGHATLATAFAIFLRDGSAPDELLFQTRSGDLKVRRSGDLLSMDLPIIRPRPVPTPPGLLHALGIDHGEVLDADDFVVVVNDESVVDGLQPDLRALSMFDRRGIAVTAQGRSFDFVSRWFGPRVGVDEDPVTGSAHAWLAPYWADRLGKERLSARQGGFRKGTLECEVVGNRVVLHGKAALFLTGEISF